MLQRRQHVFQHGAVDLGLLAPDQQLGALAQLLGRLAHHPAQTRNDAAKAHHAGTHQALLDFLVDLGLLIEQRGDVAGMLAEGVADVAQVVGDFHQRAAELLQFGKAVQLQRVKFLLVGLGAVVLA